MSRRNKYRKMFARDAAERAAAPPTARERNANAPIQRSETATVYLPSGKNRRWEVMARGGRWYLRRNDLRSQDAAVKAALEAGFGRVVGRDGKVLAVAPEA